MSWMGRQRVVNVWRGRRLYEYSRIFPLKGSMIWISSTHERVDTDFISYSRRHGVIGGIRDELKWIERAVSVQRLVGRVDIYINFLCIHIKAKIVPLKSSMFWNSTKKVYSFNSNHMWLTCRNHFGNVLYSVLTQENALYT